MKTTPIARLWIKKHHGELISKSLIQTKKCQKIQKKSY